MLFSVENGKNGKTFYAEIFHSTCFSVLAYSKEIDEKNPAAAPSMSEESDFLAEPLTLRFNTAIKYEFSFKLHKSTTFAPYFMENVRKRLRKLSLWKKFVNISNAVKHGFCIPRGFLTAEAQKPWTKLFFNQ